MIWDGERCRLVDFEAFGVGELAFEVADLVEHASSRLRRLLDPDAVIGAFDLNPAQRSRMSSYRILLACFWLAMLSPGNRGFERNPPGSVEDQAQHVLGILDS